MPEVRLKITQIQDDAEVKPMGKVIYESKSGVAIITINRPEVLNALDRETLVLLLSYLDDAATDERFQSVIITGEGRAFIAGADLKYFARYYDSGERLPYGEFIRNYLNRLILKIVNMQKPVIAAINGTVAGAAIGIALSCDYKIAVDSATFIDAFLEIGLIPDAGTTHFLLQSMPIARVSEFLTLGGTLNAVELLKYGLVNRVVKKEELVSEAMKVAQEYSNKPTRTVGMTKEIIRESHWNSLDKILEIESQLQEAQGNSEEHKKRISAFIQRMQAPEKVKPQSKDVSKYSTEDFQ